MNTQAIRDRIERLKRLRSEAAQGIFHAEIFNPSTPYVVGAVQREAKPHTMAECISGPDDEVVANTEFIATAANEWNRILQDLETALDALERYANQDGVAHVTAGEVYVGDLAYPLELWAREALATIARVDGRRVEDYYKK